MVVLDAGGYTLVIYKKKADFCGVRIMKRLHNGFSLNDNFKFDDINRFIDLLSKLIAGEENSFVFPADDLGRYNLQCEFMDLTKGSDFLLRMHFYKGKVNFSAIIDKNTLVRFQRDLTNEFIS